MPRDNTEIAVQNYCRSSVYRISIGDYDSQRREERLFWNARWANKDPKEFRGLAAAKLRKWRKRH